MGLTAARIGRAGVVTMIGRATPRDPLPRLTGAVAKGSLRSALTQSVFFPSFRFSRPKTAQY